MALKDDQSLWTISDRADPEARRLADRHYNRQKVGTKQFVPPGRCLVLKRRTFEGSAFWVTSWPFAEYVRHRWAGAWVCSAFRNEGAGRASELILSALAATRAYFGDPPTPIAMVTFIDAAKVLPMLCRGRPTFGDTWIRAGATYAGKTEGGLLAFTWSPDAIPGALPAVNPQMRMEAV
jgi:hypothetical protein